ncbi:hypothetical protein GCM10022207_09300 [Streptomyces lannensis]|uniref:Uncharacterized protein n=1 Tax=Streptomyces lannensis TaxID=766498 RepID=A0ABP7JNC0_9ACTN
MVTSTLAGGAGSGTFNQVLCPAGTFATGGGAYTIGAVSGSISSFPGGVRPIRSPPRGYQSQLSSNTGSNDNTVVFAICRA